MGQIFSQQARVTVAAAIGSSTETTLVGAGVGSPTLVSSFFQTGLALRMEASGLVAQALATPTAFVMRAKKGSTVLVATPSFTIPATGYVGVRWALDFLIVARSTTSVYCTAHFNMNGPNGNDGYVIQMPPYSGSFPTGLTTISTSSEAIGLTVQWAASTSGTESITCDALTLSTP